MKRLIFSFLLILALSGQGWGASTRYVDCDCANNGDGSASTCAAGAGQPGAYNTMDAACTAMNGGSAGDVLYIMPSASAYVATYKAINDANQKILGYSQDPDDVIVDCATATRWLDVSAAGVEIAYLTTQNASNANGAIYVTGANFTMHHTKGVDNSKHIRILDVSGASIYKNEFRGFNTTGDGFSCYFQNADDTLFYYNYVGPSTTALPRQIAVRDTAGNYSTGHVFANNVLVGFYSFVFDSDENDNTATIKNNIIVGYGNDALAGRAITTGNVSGLTTDNNVTLPKTLANQDWTETSGINQLPLISSYPRYGILCYSVDDSSSIDYAVTIADVAEEFGYHISYSLTPDDWAVAGDDAKLVDLINGGHDIVLHTNDNVTLSTTSLAISSTAANPTVTVTVDQSNADTANWTWRILCHDDSGDVADLSQAGATVPSTLTAAQVDTLGEVQAIIDALPNWAASGATSTVLETKIIKASGGAQAAPYTLLRSNATGVVAGFTMSPANYVEMVEDQAEMEAYINGLDTSQGGAYDCPDCVGYDIVGFVSAGNGTDDATADAICEAGFDIARGEYNAVASTQLSGLAIYKVDPLATTDITDTTAIRQGMIAWLAATGNISNLYSHNTGEATADEVRNLFRECQQSGDVLVKSLSEASVYIRATGACSAGCAPDDGSDQRWAITFTDDVDAKLKRTSPCRNAGATVTGVHPGTDLRGRTTPLNGAVDIGAYESRKGIVPLGDGRFLNTFKP